MTPFPLEGGQSSVQGSNNQVALLSEGNRGGKMSLAVLIDLIVQRTYHELVVLAELLPRKTDMERKIEIYNFAARTRQLFIRLLALVKWASSASKVEKSSRIMSFLDKQSMLFVDTADMLARMSRETLVQARLPTFQMPAAVEVLTTGTYSRLPLCIRDRIVPPDPICSSEKRVTLLRLNQVIQQRLVMDDLMPQMRNLKIENGRVTFHIDREFEVSLTVMGDAPNIPWRLLDINILVEDKEIGEGKPLMHLLQTNYIHQVLQYRLVDNPNPLSEVYNCLHHFCQLLQLEVLYTQTLKLMRDRLENYIFINEYTPGKCMVVSYWRELTRRDPKSELGYRLSIQVDSHDSARSLSIIHIPSLGNKETEIAERAIKSDVLSMERLLVHTIYIRTKNRLNEIKTELQTIVKNIDCVLQGSPAILSVAILQPCLRAEQLLVTVDIHTGMVQCHVPQYNTSITEELCECLNGDYSKLSSLISELRYWITQRRCEKTIQHLPATTYDRLPLIFPDDNSMMKMSKYKMFVKLHRYPNIILIVHLKEKESNPCEITYTFQLVVVKPSSIDDNITHIQHDDNIESEIPKIYLKVLTIIEFDTFLLTHGPYTSISDKDRNEVTLKRKLGSSSGSSKEPPTRRSKHPAYFIPELAHVVAMCDERIPFVVLSQKLSRRNISHQGLQVQSNAIGLSLDIVKLPPPSAAIEQSIGYQNLLKRLLSVSIRLQGKNNLKSWLVEFIFYSSPISTVSPKEQGTRRPVVFYYELLISEAVSVTVEAILNDWFQMVHLYLMIYNFNEYLKNDKYNIGNICCLKSFNYNKLILGYGTDRGALVIISWKGDVKKFKLVFLSIPNSLNAHSLMKHQFEHFLNETKNLAQLVKVLHETYKPVLSMSKLPTTPQLGVYNAKPQLPVQTFTIVTESTSLVRISYQRIYCIEVKFKRNGFVSLRDGAYSRFDRSAVVQGFTPTQGLKTFLSKYVDENAMQKTRSQSEDDNPPSPVSMDIDSNSFLTASKDIQLSGQSRDPSVKFHQPLTPPSVSNPHTPSSPHGNINQASSHSTFGSSPIAQFNLASPPSLSSNINPSPLPVMPHPSPSSNFVPNSPLNTLQSPASNIVSSSPGPNIMGHSPASGYMQTTHSENSPFASQGMLSPAASNWPNSPSLPRPSPARSGQSPLGHSMQSPQPEYKLNPPNSQMSRILPQRSWAGAVPTILTDEAFESLCCPSKHPQGFIGPEMAPLERFLGCVYMRKQLQKFIQNENYLIALPSSEPGYVNFKVETLQCTVGLNPQHLQSLHLKVTPTPEMKDLWSNEELQIIEKFFDTRVVAPPFKPNSLLGFCCMLNVPVNVLKDFIRIMRLDLMPTLCQQQQLKWAVQLCLRTPPSAPIIPVGTAGVLVSRSKILFFLQITRIGLQFGNNIEPVTIALPFVYDIHTNITLLAEKRDSGPGLIMTAANHQLKRFSEFTINSQDCSLFPAIHDLLANMVLPSEQPAIQNQQLIY